MRKRLAAVAQSVERVIGNDEVGSSNLPSSSNMNRLNRDDLSGFAVYMKLFSHLPAMPIFEHAAETHTKTHTAPKKEQEAEVYSPASCFCCCNFSQRNFVH